MRFAVPQSFVVLTKHSHPDICGEYYYQHIVAHDLLEATMLVSKTLEEQNRINAFGEIRYAFPGEWYRLFDGSTNMFKVSFEGYSK